MVTESRPGFFAWWTWKDGKAALRGCSLLALLLSVSVRALFPSTAFSGVGRLARVGIYLLEYAGLVVVFMLGAWLFRRNRITRDADRESAVG